VNVAVWRTVLVATFVGMVGVNASANKRMDLFFVGISEAARVASMTPSSRRWRLIKQSSSCGWSLRFAAQNCFSARDASWALRVFVALRVEPWRSGRVGYRVFRGCCINSIAWTGDKHGGALAGAWAKTGIASLACATLFLHTTFAICFALCTNAQHFVLASARQA